MLRLAATGLLAAVAVAGLSACGTLDGSAHPAVAVTGAPTPAAAAASAAPDGTPPAGGTGTATANASRPVSGASGSTGGAATGGAGKPVAAGGGAGGSGGAAPAAPAAKVTSLRVTVKPSCPVHGTPGAPFSSPGNDVTIAWSVTGASGAALAVDQPGVYGAYGSDYPASGTLQLPFSCTPGTTTSHTYTIWPAGAHGVSKTITVSARSDG